VATLSRVFPRPLRASEAVKFLDALFVVPKFPGSWPRLN
jgi:hypothetical protein